jgi:hypothetical protein
MCMYVCIWMYIELLKFICFRAIQLEWAPPLEEIRTAITNDMHLDICTYVYMNMMNIKCVYTTQRNSYSLNTK